MRRVVLIALLSGCMGSPSGGECHIDSDCGGSDVCARDMTCTAKSEVRSVTATWTVKGMPASVTSCGSHTDLFIQFLSSTATDELGYAPVPCMNGLFTIDKLPKRYFQVELGIDGGFRDVKPIDAQNSAALNVVF